MQESPGPGEYAEAVTSRKGGGPAYTICGRTKDPEPPSSPGPGDYHQGRVGGGPAFTMAGR